MKRAALLFFILALVAVPAFSQLRLDIGVDVPRGIGAVLQGDTQISKDAVDFFSNYVFPFPEAALHYQFDFGMVKLGVGARAFTFILETAIWPNAFAELNLGPLAIEAQAGGGLFALVGLYNSVKAGKVFMPDLSAWFKIGKKQLFRLGGGAMGIYLPEVTTEGMAFVYYLGGKVALPL
jgi:hypothetical protein